MSSFGNWPLLCFCCCCCCWNSWSLKSFWLWLRFLARGYCESLHHHRNRWLLLCSHWWQWLEMLLLGGPSPWLRLVSWCPQHDKSFPLLLVLTAVCGILWTPTRLFESYFLYQFFFSFLTAFIKKGWPYYLIWKKKVLSWG